MQQLHFIVIIVYPTCLAVQKHRCNIKEMLVIGKPDGPGHTNAIIKLGMGRYENSSENARLNRSELDVT
jgi:hypothetical protein